LDDKNCPIGEHGIENCSRGLPSPSLFLRKAILVDSWGASSCFTICGALRREVNPSFGPLEREWVVVVPGRAFYMRQNANLIPCRHFGLGSGMSRIYLASPYGFAESTETFLRDLRRELRDLGHEVRDPWEGDALFASSKSQEGDVPIDQIRAKLLHNNSKAGAKNQADIEWSEIVVAALDGPDVDSGTASEIGYARGKGKRIIGYRGDSRQAGENIGATVNLQVQFWIQSSNGLIVRSKKELLDVLRREPLRKTIRSP
jgi:nucleoside 2-deoxyribosyltransferase